MPPVVVFAPGAPDRVRRFIQHAPDRWRRGTEPPPPLDLRANAPVVLKNLGLRFYHAGLAILCFGGMAFWVMFTGLVILSNVIHLTWSQLWWWTGSVTSVVALAGLATSQFGQPDGAYPKTPYHRDERRLRRYHGRYVAADLLDTKSADLLRRAQRALTNATGSLAGDSSLLDTEVWRLAQDLERQAVLLSEYNALHTRSLSADEKTAHTRLQKNLSESRRVATAKVAALETYARGVQALGGTASRDELAAALYALRQSLKAAEHFPRARLM